MSMINRLIDNSYWSGRTVLVTGHTGFKGSWLIMCLKQLGCRVIGLGLKPNTAPSLFEEANIANFCDSHEIDIRDAKKVQVFLKEKNPEVIFHLAAQAIVYESYKTPLETFATNTMGTVNLLDGIRKTGLATTIVVVTSDKVYAPILLGRPYEEEDPLGGHDPYSASKAATEIVVACYQQAFFGEQEMALATGRSGNVIGGGDWAPYRLIPDAIRAWSHNEEILIRHPSSVRPWQHVLEPIYGYILLAQRLGEKIIKGGAYNFGPKKEDALTVEELIKLAQTHWPEANVAIEISDQRFHESNWLELNTEKSITELGFKPKWDIREAVHYTMNWYRRYHAREEPIDLCFRDIQTYFDA